MPKVILSNEEYVIYKKYKINESQESDSQHKAIEYLMNKHKYSKSNAENFVRNGIKETYHCLIGNHKAGKFTLGICRIQIEEDLDEEHSSILNDIVQYITNNEELYSKFDKNLNNQSIYQLMNRFQNILDELAEKDKSTKTNNIDNKGRYKIVGINSFDEAHEYSDYVSWCVTHEKSYFKNYTSGNKSFIFLLRDNYEDLEKPDEPNDKAPFDEYGLSMIAITVNENDKLITATSRYNHSIIGYGDHFADTQQICDIVGMDWYDILDKATNRKKVYTKPTNEDIEFIKKIQTDKELNDKLRNLKGQYSAFEFMRIGHYEITKCSNNGFLIKNSETNMGTVYSMEINNSSEWYTEANINVNKYGQALNIRCKTRGKPAVIYNFDGEKVFEASQQYPNISNRPSFKLNGLDAYICSSDEQFDDYESGESMDDINLVNTEGYNLNDIFREQCEKMRDIFAKENEEIKKTDPKRYKEINQYGDYVSRKLHRNMISYDAITSIDIVDDIALAIVASNDMSGTVGYMVLFDLKECRMLGYCDEILDDSIYTLTSTDIENFNMEYKEFLDEDFGDEDSDQDSAYVDFLCNKLGMS